MAMTIAKTITELENPATGNFLPDDILIIIDSGFIPEQLKPESSQIHMLNHSATWRIIPYGDEHLTERICLISNNWESAEALLPELVTYLNLDPNKDTVMPPFPFTVIGSISCPDNPKHWIIQKQDQDNQSTNGTIDPRKYNKTWEEGQKKFGLR